MSTPLNAIVNLDANDAESNARTISLAVIYETPESDPESMSCPERPSVP